MNAARSVIVPGRPRRKNLGAESTTMDVSENGQGLAVVRGGGVVLPGAGVDDV